MKRLTTIACLLLSATGCTHRALSLAGPARDLGGGDLGPDAALASFCHPGEQPVLLADDVDPFASEIALDGDFVLYSSAAGLFTHVPRRGGARSTYAMEGATHFTVLPDRIDYTYYPTPCAVVDCQALHELDRVTGAITVLVESGVPAPSAIAADADDVVVIGHGAGPQHAEIRLDRYRRAKQAFGVLRTLVGPGQGLTLVGRNVNVIDDGVLHEISLLTDHETTYPTPAISNTLFAFARQGDEIFATTGDGALYQLAKGQAPALVTFESVLPANLVFDERDLVVTGWNGDARVRAISRADASIRTLAAGEADTRALALDESCVYYTTGAGSPANLPQHLYRAPR